MKKVILSAAIILGGVSTYATPSTAIHQLDGVVTGVQEEFKAIEIEELPQAVKDALAADFMNATLNKAYVNAEQEYKLEITVDGAAGIVYADMDGNWIEKE